MTKHQNFMGAYNDTISNERVEIRSSATLDGNRFTVVIDSSNGNNISKREYEIDGSEELENVKTKIKNINYLNKSELETVKIYLNSFEKTIKSYDKKTANDIIKAILLNCSLEVKNIIIGAIGSSVQANVGKIDEVVKFIIEFFSKK